MQKIASFRKTIHFPGGYGQRRQMFYQFLRPEPSSTGPSRVTQVILMEDEEDPFKYDPDWGFINSDAEDSTEIADYLVNKILLQELGGCGLEYIEFFFISRMNDLGVRHVNKWNFAVDMDHPIGVKCDEYPIMDFNSLAEKLLFSVGIHSFRKKPLRFATNHKLAGIYPVRVNIEKPEITGHDKKALLDSLGLTSRT